jgi:hypothetical protein
MDDCHSDVIAATLMESHHFWAASPHISQTPDEREPKNSTQNPACVSNAPQSHF